MYGLPNSSALSFVVHELTATHERTVGDLHGPEPALLLQLQHAVASNTAGAYGTGGGERTGAPIDPTALALRDEIADSINTHAPGKPQAQLCNVPMALRLQHWTRSVAGTEQEKDLLEMCEYWRSRIRDLLDPPKRVQLRGVSCPSCGYDVCLQKNQYGETMLAPTLLAHLSEHPLRAECLACGKEWRDGELHNLGAADEFKMVPIAVD